ncbi:MAG: ABC transporter ATP-binding protein [Nitrospirae bacterium]|nr:ABC transporter ATP-binding protein [Nitrospirota bacterium]
MDTYAAEDAVKGPTDYGTLARRLLPFIRKYPLLFWGGSFFVVLSMLLGSAVPYFVARAIDEGILRNDRRVLYLMGGLVLGFEAVRVATQSAYRYLLQAMGQNVMLDLRTDLFRHVQKLPVSYFDRHPTGRVVTRLTNDVSALGDLFSSGLVVIVGDVCVIAGSVGFMAAMNLKLTLLFLLTFPPMVWASMYFARRMKGIYREIRRKLALINGFLGERLNPTAMSTIKLYNAEEKTSSRFAAIVEDYFQELMHSTRTYGMFHPIITVLTSIGVGLILFQGGHMYLENQEITMGVLVAFLSYSQNLHTPIRDMIDKFNIFQAAMSSGERVWTVFNEPPEVGSSLELTQVAEFEPVSIQDLTPRGPARVDFDHVSFHYIPGSPVLKDINLSLVPGKRNALVGVTGSGKTTVAHLMVRFYEPSEGRILLDGVDLRRMSREDVRRRIGLVSQEPFLFSGSMERFLNEHRNGAGDVARWLERYGLESLLDKLQRNIRGGGVNLSMGERQVFSLVRALAYNAKLVIFDEATSYVDPEAEHKIRQILADAFRDRTLLVIAHRLSTIAECDQVWVLSRGELVQQMTGEEFRRTLPPA